MSEAEGMTLLREYNTRCLPPWPESRLTYKMNEALKPDLHDKPRGHIRMALPLVASVLRLIFEELFSRVGAGELELRECFEPSFELAGFEATGSVADAVFGQLQQVDLNL